MANPIPAIEFLDIEQYRAEIEDKAPFFKTVELAWTMEPVEDFEEEVPAALVYPGEQYSTRDSDSPTSRQGVVSEIRVLIVCKLSDLSRGIKDLREALFGFQPGEKFEETKYRNRGERPFGRPIDIKAKYVWWEETYEVQHLDRRAK